MISVQPAQPKAGIKPMTPLDLQCSPYTCTLFLFPIKPQTHFTKQQQIVHNPPKEEEEEEEIFQEFFFLSL
jgi:hypothetical protein